MRKNKSLNRIMQDMKKFPAQRKSKDIIYTPDGRGQWDYPGFPTRIPGNNITMQGVPYPIKARTSTGYEDILYPGQIYNFPDDVEYVDEFPLMQARKGGVLPQYQTRGQVNCPPGPNGEAQMILPNGQCGTFADLQRMNAGAGLNRAIRSNQNVWQGNAAQPKTTTESKSNKVKVPYNINQQDVVRRGDIATQTGTGTAVLQKKETARQAIANQDFQKGVQALVSSGMSQEEAERKYRNYKQNPAAYSNVKKTIDDYEARNYRIQHHPDYDPNKSFDEQSRLADDNSIRARLLRGSNMLTNTGNTGLDLVTGIITSPGRSFANITTDAKSRYLNPMLKGNVGEGLLNFGLDLLDVAPTSVIGAVSRLPKGIKQAGNYLTTQTPLRNAYKYNPLAFKPNQNNWYRQVGKDAVDDAFQTGIVRGNNEVVTQEGFEKFLQSKPGDPVTAPYFSKGNPYFANLKNKNYLIETGLPNENFQKSYMWSFDKGTGPNEMGAAVLQPNPQIRGLDNFNIYKQDWLRGYKPVSKPGILGSSQPLQSGFGLNMGDFRQMITNPKQYFTKPGGPQQWEIDHTQISRQSGTPGTSTFQFTPTTPQIFTDPRLREVKHFMDMDRGQYDIWRAHNDARLQNLVKRGQEYDAAGLAESSDWLNPQTVHYHGVHGGRPIVEVKMPNGNSEYFYKSTGWAGKEGAGASGTTEGMWQVYDQHGLNFNPETRRAVHQWFGKGEDYKNWYGSNTFRNFAGQMDKTIAEKLGVPFDKVDEAIQFFPDRRGNDIVNTFNPEFAVSHDVGSIVPRTPGRMIMPESNSFNETGRFVKWGEEPPRVIDWGKVGKVGLGAGFGSGLLYKGLKGNDKKRKNGGSILKDYYKKRLTNRRIY